MAARPRRLAHETGGHRRQRGDKEERRKEYGQARDILLRLTALDPSNATWRNDLAWVEQQLDETARQQGGKVRK